MTMLLRRRSLLLLVTLALSLFAPAVRAQAPGAIHRWKAGYAKRMAENPMERREKLERRRAERKKARRASRERVAPARGQRARPADDPGRPRIVTGAPVRPAQRFEAGAIPTPANEIVNDRTADGPASGQSETSIVAIGNRMVAAWNDGEGFSTTGDTQGWATSIDGGLTWVDHGTFPHPPAPATFEWTSDPVLTVNEKSGAIYFTALFEQDRLAANWRSGVAVVKGRWSGDTFTWGVPAIVRTVPISDDFIDKPWIVADSSSGRVFLSYTRFPLGFSRIDFQWADSGLAVFASPQQISLNVATENGWVQGSRPIVDGDGRLYVMYYLIGQTEADYYKVSRSLNGGVSFNPPTIAATVFTNFGTGAPGFNRPIGVQFAGIAADRSHGPDRGRLYLTWPESINWLDDVGSIGQGGNKSEVEVNNTAGAATPAVLGQTLRGAVSNLTDIDFFSIPLTAGQHLIAAADSTAAVGEMRLRLFAGDGTTRLTFTTFDATINPSPQFPDGIPSGWLFTAPATGTYYLAVDSRPGVGGGGTGSYRVRIGAADQGGERGRDQRDIFVASSTDGIAWSTPVRVSDTPVGFDDWLPEVAVAPDGGVYGAWYDFSAAPPATNGGQSTVALARSGDAGITWTTLGQVADVLSNWSASTTNIEPNQGDYIALFASDSHVWPCWADVRLGNPDVFTARVPIIPNGVTAAFEAVRLGARSISIDWQATPADTVTMRLYRSTDGGPYQYLDLLYFDTGGQATYTDTTVVANHAYDYRLGRFVNGVEIFHGQVHVFLPLVFPFSLASPRPNPVVGSSYGVSFSLATDEPAVLTLHDITGREVFRRTLNDGQGAHTLTLPVAGNLPQGLYILRLRQGSRDTSTRFHLVR
jgi:hypothetical protein